MVLPLSIGDGWCEEIAVDEPSRSGSDDVRRRKRLMFQGAEPGSASDPCRAAARRQEVLRVNPRPLDTDPKDRLIGH